MDAPYHSIMTSSTKAMAALSAILLMAVFTMPVGSIAAEARESDDDRDDDDEEDKREFSRLVRGSDDDRDEDRKAKKDPRDAKNRDGHFDRKLKDLDIKNYGFDGKDAYIEVHGKAGRTLPSHHMEAIAYVLDIVTKSGEAQTWAIDSHEAQHGSSTDPSKMWHAHRVHLTDDPATPEVDATCLNEVDEVLHAMADGDRMIFENMKGKSGAIKAKKITSAATVLLDVQVDDPDAPLPDGVHCIAKVAHVYDMADLDKRERRD